MTKFLVFFSCLAVAFAQVETTTSITGNVTGQQGAAFSGATVKLSNQNSGAIRDTTTNSEGVYLQLEVGSTSEQVTGAVPQNFGSGNVSFARQPLNFVQAGNQVQFALRFDMDLF